MVFTSLRSVQSGHPPDVLHPVFVLIRVCKHRWVDIAQRETIREIHFLHLEFTVVTGGKIITLIGQAVSETVWDKEEIIYADLDMQKVPA